MEKEKEKDNKQKDQKLTIDGQIADLKSKNITFDSASDPEKGQMTEEDAKKIPAL